MILSIIGPTFAGKSLVSRGLLSRFAGRALMFAPGWECRCEFGAAALAKMANPNAPGGPVRQFVQRRCSEVMAEARCEAGPYREFATPKHVILDGMPRTVGEAEWLIGEVKEHEETMLVLSLAVTPDEQRDRMYKRDGSDPAAFELAEARLGHDRALAADVAGYLAGRAGIAVIPNVRAARGWDAAAMRIAG